MKSKKLIIIGLGVLITGTLLSLLAFVYYLYIYQKTISFNLQNGVNSATREVESLKNEDQRKKNMALTDTINQIKLVYKKSVVIYEDLVDFRLLSKTTVKQDAAYANIISLLAAENYATASSKLDELATEIKTETQKAAAAAAATVQKSATNSDGQVVYVTADLSNTRVIVDTASDGDCGNNCPVLPLSTYVSRNGAYAGINGSYFCPASYPSCAGKTNSFDLLVMNKNKKYFNSDNNVYSNNPGVIFGGSYIRFVTAVSQWGRDTGIDSMLSNYPLTVFNSNINFGGNNDPKQGSKGNRSFMGNKGNTVYIGVVFNVTVAESAQVLKSMGLENALNLDSGGSTALWNGGYKVGPGRDIPNAILFVRK